MTKPNKNLGIDGPKDRDRCGALTAGSGYKKTCKKWPVRGARRCQTHGSGAKQVKVKAQERLASAADWLMAELLHIAKSAKNEAVRLAAVNSALDRAGLGAKQIIALEAQSQWEDTFDGVTDVAWGDDAETEIATLQAEVSRLRAVAAGHAQPELPAARPPAQVDDRPSGPLEGRVLDDDEPWPPRP